MQLLALAVYNAAGERRDVPFLPGQLNIVTGASATGKSALLDIVEYCLGRDTIMMPVGPITATVTWYAALFVLPDGGQAFVARPAPQSGRASTQLAMLECGAQIGLLPHESLTANIDTSALRQQLGRRIGIEENQHEPPAGALRPAVELGAGLLCLQGQDEIASRVHLFHRQGDAGMEQTLKDTIPYFLGVAARDQGLKRARLREARRTLARATAAFEAARRAAQTLESQLRALLSEAFTVGLIEASEADGRVESIRLLEQVSHAADGRATLDGGDPRDQTERGAAYPDRRHELRREQTALRDRLRTIATERQLLLDTVEGEVDYRGVLTGQIGRLT